MAKELSTKKKNKNTRVDSIAACIIMEEFLKHKIKYIGDLKNE
jgi:RNase H-fold protein (predicted Holliday junction resolvase)